MTETTTQLSIIDIYAQERHLQRDDLVAVLMKTIMPVDKQGTPLATKADMIGFLQIARKFDLDPWAKEIIAIYSRGRVVPYIPIDGYTKIVNRQAEYDGCEFDYEQNPDGQFLAVTCSMFRKDRSRPTRITEFMSECYRPDSDAWKRNPARMLRHRAFIQAARLTFGVSGALDEDSAEAMIDITPQAEIEAPKQAPKAPAKSAPKPKDDTGYRSFEDDKGKEQQRKDGPDEQPPSDRQEEQKPAAETRKKAPPAANKSEPPAEQKPAQPAGSGHKMDDHGRPDEEEFVNSLNDRLNEAKDVEQLREIWVDFNPPDVLSNNEALLRYAQKIFDKLEAKLKEKA